MQPGYEAMFAHGQSSVKSLVHFPCPYAEDYANQEYKTFFEMDSSVKENKQIYCCLH